MDLVSISASRLVDAMETSIIPHNSNPLKNKIVHADIRVQGIEDDTDGPTQVETSVQLVEQPTPSAEDVEAQERAEEMQSWWNNEMKKHMNQPDGYAKVAVLLIKWDDELDELATKTEAIELEDLFRNRFHYYTKTVELNVRQKPQHQLNSHVSDFILDHDGPHNLLIVYYTGHGVFHEDKKFLELTACTNPLVCKGFSRDAKVNWNKVEDKLRDEENEGDVLTILDTCYASNLVKKSSSREPKKFELIAACPIDQTTAAPGEFSFTRALIDSLHELLNEHKEPISTFRLVQSINLNKHRSDTPAHVWARNAQTEQHIFLAPLKPPKVDIAQPSKFRSAPGGYLTLRFGVRDATLNKQQIEYMTKTLSNALFNKALIGLRKVEWLDMKAAPPIPHFDRVALVMYAATQWKKVISKRKLERESQSRSVDHVMLPDVEEMEMASQKRGWDGEEDGPDAKRRYLEPGQPLSPPVSDSWRG
ncbi:hypothetical protein DE146DRAFT_126534 [Phaeosphaeria sp. MPI-PUGE-AT-0046c]|nr:hypothetical protein DE146DRAFT_126534 [Phaeosphaeria sp. MPI-PUGE-AT-0046c]